MKLDNTILVSLITRPSVPLLLLSFLGSALGQKFLLEAVTSVHSVPPVARPDPVPVSWGLRPGVLRIFLPSPVYLLLLLVLRHGVILPLPLLQQVLSVLVIHSPRQRLRHLIQVILQLMRSCLHLSEAFVPLVIFLLELLRYFLPLPLFLLLSLGLSKAASNNCLRILPRHFFRQTFVHFSLTLPQLGQFIFQVFGVLKASFLPIQSFLHSRWRRVRIRLSASSGR